MCVRGGDRHRRAVSHRASGPLRPAPTIAQCEQALDVECYGAPQIEQAYDMQPLPPLAGSGGLSSVFSRPFYQDSVAYQVGRQRGVPDVSMSAACTGAVNVYLSFAPIPPGWYQVCGTSEASPLFSGLVAIADQAAHHDLGLLNPRLYALGDRFSSGIVDITRGNNTVTFVQPSTGQTITVQGYNAVPGYDLASGLGTADGARLVADLAGYRIGFARR